MLRYFVLCITFLHSAYEIVDSYMYTFNVGQGNCQLAKYYLRDIETKHRKTIGFLVDCGNSEMKYDERFNYIPGHYVKIIGKNNPTENIGTFKISNSASHTNGTNDNKKQKQKDHAFEHVAHCLSDIDLLIILLSHPDGDHINELASKVMNINVDNIKSAQKYASKAQAQIQEKYKEIQSIIDKSTTEAINIFYSNNSPVNKIKSIIHLIIGNVVSSLIPSFILHSEISATEQKRITLIKESKNANCFAATKNAEAIRAKEANNEKQKEFNHAKTEEAKAKIEVDKNSARTRKETKDKRQIALKSAQNHRRIKDEELTNTTDAMNAANNELALANDTAIKKAIDIMTLEANTEIDKADGAVKSDIEQMLKEGKMLTPIQQYIENAKSSKTEIISFLCGDWPKGDDNKETDESKSVYRYLFEKSYMFTPYIWNKSSTKEDATNFFSGNLMQLLDKSKEYYFGKKKTQYNKALSNTFKESLEAIKDYVHIFSMNTKSDDANTQSTIAQFMFPDKNQPNHYTEFICTGDAELETVKQMQKGHNTNHFENKNEDNNGLNETLHKNKLKLLKKEYKGLGLLMESSKESHKSLRSLMPTSDVILTIPHHGSVSNNQNDALKVLIDVFQANALTVSAGSGCMHGGHPRQDCIDFVTNNTSNSQIIKEFHQRNAEFWGRRKQYFDFGLLAFGKGTPTQITFNKYIWSTYYNGSIMFNGEYHVDGPSILRCPYTGKPVTKADLNTTASNQDDDQRYYTVNFTQTSSNRSGNKVRCVNNNDYHDIQLLPKECTLSFQKVRPYWVLNKAIFA